MFRHAAAPLLATALLAAPGLARGDEPAAAAPDRPRIGVVLSGGGARGAAHVGVLKVLEEMRVPVDVVTGTSMGSIVGGLYAAGLTPAEMIETLTSLDWNDALTDRSQRDLLDYRRKQLDELYALRARVGLQGTKIKLPLGIIQGQKLEQVLRALTLQVADVEEFDELVVPYRAIATDLATTEAVVLERGDLVRAMRASMSVPIVFAPVEIDGRLLVDGGIAINLPVQVARELGAEVIIAVDISANLAPVAALGSAYAVNDQMLTGLMRRQTNADLASLGPDDVAIVPDLHEFTAASFTSAAAIIPRGEAAARAEAVRARLARYALSEEEWARYRTARRIPDRSLPVVREIRVRQDSALDESFLRSLLDTEAGKPLDLGLLRTDLQRLYGLDLWERVGYRLLERDARGAVLEIDARRRSWGPDYVRLGITLQDDVEGSTAFNFRFRLNKFEITRSGGEWVTELQLGENQLARTELYQPVGGRRRFFAAARLEARRDPALFLAGSESAIDTRQSAYGGALDFGSALGAWGEIRLGLRYEEGRYDLRAGGDGLRDLDYVASGPALRLGWDTLDNASFPRRGGGGSISYLHNLEALGADENLGRAELRFLHAFPTRRGSLLAGLSTGAFTEDDTAFAQPFTLGGFLSLSGLGSERLAGRFYGLGRVLYLHRLLELDLGAIKSPIYLGGSLEYGGAWLTSDAIDTASAQLHGSLFVGIDSPLGPVYLGYGAGDGGTSAAYLFIGRAF
ncbi:MAG: patatin-like phospholipase family protein [Thermoanaerobaculia bacterium]|nr:patatin-like phospholipase family protein [Thermoanaerobaculia bacterium]